MLAPRESGASVFRTGQTVIAVCEALVRMIEVFIVLLGDCCQ